jgi:TusA-related sulfurtransferase
MDTRGLFCPLPIIKTSEAIKNIDSGSVVEVISDDPAIEFDLPAWCKSQGHEIVSGKAEAGVYRYLVRKSRKDG